MESYPDIGLEEAKFDVLPSKHEDNKKGEGDGMASVRKQKESNRAEFIYVML